MEMNKVLFEELEGRDDWGKPKAACSLTIQRIISAMETEVVQSVSTISAEVTVYSTPLWIIVDLYFEDTLDYDFLQMSQVCMNYLKMVNASTEELSLVLTVTPLGDYDYFLVGVSGVWSFHSEEPDKQSNSIRFLFMKDCFGVYELTDESMEDMIMKACQEMESGERGHMYG